MRAFKTLKWMEEIIPFDHNLLQPALIIISQVVNPTDI